MQGYTKAIPLDTDPLLALNSDQVAATQKATRAYVDGKTPANATTLAKITESSNLPLWNGGIWPTQGREILTADRTYYVRTDGSDSNTGLANTAGGAFLTPQKAINVALGSLDSYIYNVTIQIADGTYTGNVVVAGDMVGAGYLTIQGNSGSTSAVTLTASSGNTLIVSSAKRCYVKWLKLTGTGTVAANFVAKDGAVTILTSINHQAQVGQAFNQSQAGAIAYVTGNRTLSGNFSYGDYCDGATIYNFSNTTTISGTPAISGAFASIGNLNSGGTILYQSVTFSGSATGKRYEANRNAVINTLGQASTYLPGNVGGTVANGGLYV